AAPPSNGPTMYSQSDVHSPPPIVALIAVGPMPTAGLNAPPLIGPPANAATTMGNPMASPENELPWVLADAAELRTTRASAKVYRNSTSSAPNVVAFSLGAGAKVCPVIHFTTRLATMAPRT